MPVTDIDVSPLGQERYQLTWSGGTAPYNIIKNGLVIDTTSDTQAIITAENNDIIDVIEEGEIVPAGYPLRASINWPPSVQAENYIVEEFFESAWVQRAQFFPGLGFYTWQTRQLEDNTTHQFRVKSIDSAGNDSIADDLTFLFVRVPDPPTSVTYTYANPNLVITAV